MSRRAGRPKDVPAAERDLIGEVLTRAGEGAQDWTPYAADPVAFAEEVLGQAPWSKQQEVMRAVSRQKQVSVRSSHGVGKTFTAASLALWWAYCYRPSLVLSTAPTARQVESLLWAEIGRLWRKAIQPLGGRCLNVRLEAGDEQQGQGLTTNEPEKFAGWHCENLLVIVDEASGVPDSLFEVLQGTLTSANCKLLLIGNPTRTDGYFAQSQRLWAPGEKLRLNSYDSPNFQQEEVTHPYLVTRSWVEARKNEWGEDSDAWRVRVMGEFPTISADNLIALEWVERAVRDEGLKDRDEGRGVRDEVRQGQRPGPEPLTPSPLIPHPSALTPITIGVDVARFGDCETVAAVRSGDELLYVEGWHGADLMGSCGRVVALWDQWKAATIAVDAVGLGAGLLDRLLEIQRNDAHRHGCRIEAFSSGSKANAPDKFKSRRDESFFGLRERYRDGSISHAAEWPKLTGQLTSLRYGFDSRGRVEIESKDAMRKRGKPSPDWADAVAIAFAGPSGGFSLPAAAGVTR